MSFLSVKSCRQWLLSGLAGLVCTVAADLVQAADFPQRPISMVVPFTAGGPTDSVGRPLAEALRRALNQSVVVENRAGAGGTVGTGYVARVKPDGYTTLLMHIGFSTAPSLYENPGYRVDDFAPIGMVVEVPMTLITHNDFPASTIQELLEYIRTHSSSIALAHAGIGSASHLCGIMLAHALGVELLAVPYKGTAPAMNDLIGKRVDLMCDQTTNTTSHIQAGTVKAFAVTSAERVPTLNHLPTLKEAGLDDFEIGIWYGYWVPGHTPTEIRSVLNTALQTAVRDPEFQQRMQELGTRTLADYVTPQALQAKVEQQLAQWRELFQSAGVGLQAH